MKGQPHTSKAAGMLYGRSRKGHITGYSHLYRKGVYGPEGDKLRFKACGIHGSTSLRYKGAWSFSWLARLLGGKINLGFLQIARQG